MAKELVKQGYATWEKNPKEEQQRIVGKQVKQPQTASSENASPGMNSNTVVSATGKEDHKNSMTSEDSSKIKSEESGVQEDNTLVLGGDVQPPAEFWDEYDSEDGLEMG